MNLIGQHFSIREKKLQIFGKQYALFQIILSIKLNQIFFRIVQALCTMALGMTAFYVARKMFQKFQNHKKATNILQLVGQNKAQPNQQFNIQAFNPEVMSIKMCIAFSICGLVLLFIIFAIVPKIEHKNAIFPLIPPFCHSIIFPICVFCFNGKFRKFVFEMCT